MEIVGLAAALSELEATGLPAIGERVQLLAGRLRAGLTERGYQIVGPGGTGAGSPIVTFTLADGGIREVYDHLTAAGCVISYPNGAIRVAPHFWTTDEEIAVFLDSLPVRPTRRTYAVGVRERTHR